MVHELDDALSVISCSVSFIVTAVGVKVGTKDPEFNETLNFDVENEALATVVFLVMVSHRSVPEV